MRALYPLSLATLLALSTHAAPASATPNFPAAIQSDLMLSAAPACTICHSTNAGGEGTVTQPFGISMRAAGLVQYDVASLDAALATLKKNETSSVGDGVPDITKLEEGKDPNVPLNGSFGPVEPSYGCGATVAGRPLPGASAVWSVVGGLGLAIVLARVRRRRRPR